MALVYGAADTNFFFSLLNQTFSVSISFSEPSGVLPAAVVTAAKGLLIYDDTARHSPRSAAHQHRIAGDGGGGDAALVAAIPPSPTSASRQ